jgi:hypothetical protein
MVHLDWRSIIRNLNAPLHMVYRILNTKCVHYAFNNECLQHHKKNPNQEPLNKKCKS